jgi:hypothetical protein
MKHSIDHQQINNQLWNTTLTILHKNAPVVTLSISAKHKVNGNTLNSCRLGLEMLFLASNKKVNRYG